ncbi:hypothetical protein SUGI_0996430 [Cryptomeria japonica]|nr:hypothetical protein SUGI_0996430 [Cryptomeria japonica]
MEGKHSYTLKLVWFMVGLVGAAMMISGGVKAAISCSTVTSDLSGCLSYVTGGSSQPSASCCSGVRTLNSAAATPPDRRAACSCIKSIAGEVPGFRWDRAGQLPAQCGVNIGFPITPKFNYSTIN